MYNGTLGALRITEDYVRRGITFYYANYQKQASKEYYGGSWPCCSGTYFLNLCDVFDRLYFKSEDALYVANYVSSEVENNYGGRNVILTQETDFPEDSKAEFTVRCTSKVDFALKLRIPEWATGYSVTLNGKTVNAAVDADGWLTVGESFCNGDKIVLDIVSPIPCHAEQSAAVLNAGKHCACAVPMATSLEDVKNIVEAVEKSGKNYMMMETSLYTYQFFYVKNMIESGQTGKIQFLRGSHYQDMAGWSDYWMGLPPMWYGTHAIAPMVLLSGSRIKRVNCFGSGTMSECLRRQYGNPYPVETALFEFENGLKAEATRSLFETARAYKEGLSVYGSKASFEWGFSDGDDPYVTVALPLEKGQRGSGFEVKQVKMPNYHASLPFQIQRFTVGDKFDPIDPQRSLSVGSGGPHHGSHPHLVNEFIMSIVENRKPWIDETISANITSAGICAHISAMKNGESVIVPAFD
ncbi:MAG: glycoside hydrolase family 127 protein [Clostridia bacterium]|nr:glycoside hydrolase family 127 protein [Clostridia bacterium]